MTPAETEVEIERLHAAGFAWALACCGRRREEAEDVLRDDPFSRYLFPPDRVMGHSLEIGLEDAQKLAIRKEIKKTQISLFVRIKNILTPAQQAKLAEIQKAGGK